MSSYSLTHLSDQTLLRDLVAHLANERASAAIVLAHIAEVDARRLYAPAGYPSMYLYCLNELHLSEDAALMRIRAARLARQFPALFVAMAEGRVHVTAVVRIGKHLTQENADELIAAATHKTRVEIETLLARRFPQADVPTRLEPIPLAVGAGQVGTELGPDRVDGMASASAGGDLVLEPAHEVAQEGSAAELVPDRVGGMRPQPARGELSLEPVRTVPSWPRVTPLAPARFALQVTIGQSAHDKLRYAQELMSHQLPSGDIAEIFERALDALIPQLEKRKFAATTRPRKGASCSEPGSRQIPAQVKRVVWKRDGGQCTFVSAKGKRCSARKLLEFDHVDPVALGGRASVSGIRLRCHAHNQYEAERTFGAEFMENKRRAAEALAAVSARAEALADTRAKAEAAARTRAATLSARWRRGRRDPASAG